MENSLNTLENQLCFPLYACSKEIIRRYRPFLDPLDLTYTQYIVLLVLWEKQSLSVKALGEYLYLDSGTLTPLLKKLEVKGYITRSRSEKDERRMCISLTERGEALRQQALPICQQVDGCVQLSSEEMRQLHGLLSKMMSGMEA